MNRKKVPDNFNPYHKWLGIPEKKCPPTFYELLGISLDEADPKVIQSAAERQKTHVEQFLGTSYNKYANQLISQIDEAEITLLSPELRREYDRQVDLFKKRRKKRQFDPTVGPSSIRIGNRSVGEGSGIVREYAGIVTILCVAFFCMAAASFWLPWGRLEADKQQNPNQALPVPKVGNKGANNKNTDEDKAVKAANTQQKMLDPESNEIAVNSIGMKFKLLSGGTFLMGDTESDDKHQVTLTKPFELGIHEVTQKQYEQVTGTNPSQIKGPDNPVDSISWEDATEFCHQLSELPAEKAAGHTYKLPTEAEWEYACRAGSTTKYCFGDNDSQLAEYGWYHENSGWHYDDPNDKTNPQHKTHPVGTSKPNQWGIHDMHGNVFEWCQDWFAKYPDNAVSDPLGPKTGKNKVLRGGGCSNIASYCGSGRRHNSSPDSKISRYGFRVVRSNNPTETLTNSIGMKLKLLPSGTFIMGDDKNQKHKVQLTKPFYMGVYEVTQEQYEQVMGSNPSAAKDPNLPVQLVSWNEAQAFCNRLSELQPETENGRSYRLPTEAEWEYACRAGTTTTYSFGDTDEQLKDHAWYLENIKHVQPVGLKPPNPWGLYDMHGNVFEWCQDWSGNYPEELAIDPTGPSEGELRVYRGGGKGGIARCCHSAYRDGRKPTYKATNLGFRVVMEFQETGKSVSKPVEQPKPLTSAQKKVKEMPQPLGKKTTSNIPGIETKPQDAPLKHALFLLRHLDSDPKKRGVRLNWFTANESEANELPKQGYWNDPMGMLGYTIGWNAPSTVPLGRIKIKNRVKYTIFKNPAPNVEIMGWVWLEDKPGLIPVWALKQLGANGNWQLTNKPEQRDFLLKETDHWELKFEFYILPSDETTPWKAVR